MLNYDEFCTYLEVFHESSKRTSDGVEVYPPNYPDLFSLYSKVISSRSLAVLEFGSGWSTFVFALALQENKDRDLGKVGSIRHPNLYQLMTIDCENRFMKLAVGRIPRDLTVKIHQIETKAYMSVLNDQICTLYQNLPAFTADFIYLDGPDCGPDQILGDVDGYSINYGHGSKAYGLPMSADLIRLEPHLWPGTIIVTDGRGANARFLKNNFRRNWEYYYDDSLDQHVFQLDEPAWGMYSKLLLGLKQESS
jgi:hypothetical protein